MTACLSATHSCEGIGCEYCVALEVVQAGDRELARKATPRHKAANRSKRHQLDTNLPILKTMEQQPLVSNGEPFVPLPGNLSTPQKALQFILAGNAYFTLRSLKTGTRYTYRVNVAKAQPGLCKWCRKDPCSCNLTYFVALLSGPDNENDYTYLGVIKENVFRLTRASKMTADSLPVKAFEWTLSHLMRREFPAQLEVWHEGRCGRKLTVPDSVAAGIGPECAGRL
jgi:hypothetical protein